MNPEEDNGILAQIGGALIGKTSSQLPPAGPDSPEFLATEVDAGPPHGTVVIRYQLQRHRRGKSATWFWVAVHAERAPISTGTNPPQAA